MMFPVCHELKSLMSVPYACHHASFLPFLQPVDVVAWASYSVFIKAALKTRMCRNSLFQQLAALVPSAGIFLI
jgi:hypothetical protein